MRCPVCGGSARVDQVLLGGYVRGRCATCGEFSAKALQGRARASDPETSKAAAESIDPTGQQRLLLAAVRELGEATRDEAARQAGLTTYQASRRLSELREQGLVTDTGETRPGESGRQQMVVR